MRSTWLEDRAVALKESSTADIRPLETPDSGIYRVLTDGDDTIMTVVNEKLQSKPRRVFISLAFDEVAGVAQYKTTEEDDALWFSSGVFGSVVLSASHHIPRTIKITPPTYRERLMMLKMSLGIPINFAKPSFSEQFHGVFKLNNRNDPKFLALKEKYDL